MMWTVWSTLCWSFAVGFQSFPSPTFQSAWFNISSDTSEDSFKVVEHGLGTVPIMVKVIVQVREGPNHNYTFEASGSAQVDDDINTHRGGVIYAYNCSSVIIWCATAANNNRNQNYPLFMGGAWGNGTASQVATQVVVQVQAWAVSSFYQPDFVSETFQMSRGRFKEVNHDFGELPVWLNVRGSFISEGNRIFFDGTGSQQHKRFNDYSHIAGILFAYNDNSVRLWSAEMFLFVSHDGWSHESYSLEATEADVQVFAWVSEHCLSPIFNSDWFPVDQLQQTFYQLNYSMCSSRRHVDVEMMAIDGNNNGFVFQGTGMCQSTGQRTSTDRAGGVVFAHSQKEVRLWFLSLDLAMNAGLITVQGWGGGMHQQLSSKANVRVRVWCENPIGTPYCHQSKDKQQWLLPKNYSSFQNPLVLLGSAAASPIRCAGFCVRERMCTAFTNTDGNCALFGDFQFGDVIPDQPNLDDLSRIGNASDCSR